MMRARAGWVVACVATLALLAPCSAEVSLRSLEVDRPPKGSYLMDARHHSKLSEKTVDTVNHICETIEKELTDEIGVVLIDRMIRSRGEEDIEDYTKGVFDNWGVGKKEKNNGVMILVSEGDRQMRIQTGKGALRRLTTRKAQIIIKRMTKFLKRGELEDAILEGVLRSADALKGKEIEEPKVEADWFDTIVFWIIGSVVGGVALTAIYENFFSKRSTFEKRMRRVGNVEDYSRTCSICMDDFTPENTCEGAANPAVLTRCNHAFHLDCITEWTQRNDTCPLCRARRPGTERPESNERPQAPPGEGPAEARADRPPQGRQRWFTPRRHYRPGYHSRYNSYYNNDARYMFRPMTNPQDVNVPTRGEIFNLQQELHRDLVRDYNIDRTNYTCTRKETNRSSSGGSSSKSSFSSSKSSFGGGRSFGGGGASGSW